MKKLENCIVFSEDIKLIMEGNNALNYRFSDKGIIIPDDNFIRNIRMNFYNIMKDVYDTNVVIVTEKEMKDAMESIVEEYKGKYPIVSMDQIYIDCDNKDIYSLDVTRVTGSKEMVSRADPLDKDSVRKQVSKIANMLKANKQDSIILLDDVIFSGSVIDYISKLFSEYNIKVIGAGAAISSNEAYNRFSTLDKKVKCEFLMMNNVIDEICERDFFYGIPQSGMVKVENGIAFKAPYVLPFGDPVARASCPESKKGYLSKELIQLSLMFWEETQRLSNKIIMNYELPERILNTDINESVVKTLKKELK